MSKRVKICGQLVYVDYFCGFESKEGNSLLAANGFNFVLKSVQEGVINGDRPPLCPSLLIQGGKQRARWETELHAPCTWLAE